MIHIFKTSVESEDHVAMVTPALNQLFAHPAQWNFDIDDCDHILRVEGAHPSASATCIALLNHHGFSCEELLD